MNKKSFLESVDKFIRTNALMDRNALYLTALSGGADSVALTLVLKQLGYRIEAAHCNFRLRDKESDRDEAFCRQFCLQQGIAIHTVHFDTREYATLHKVSIEMAARKLRYSYFAQLIDDLGAEAVCVGHHSEDSVETLLINLIRGTGINGLTGIAPKNGTVVRPLLCVSRGDIEGFLKCCGQDFVTDSTNLVDDVTRNRIRLNLMPLIKGINPSADKDMALTAHRISEAAKVFNRAIQMSAERVTESKPPYTLIDIAKLKAEVSPEYTLFSILSPFGFSPATIEDIHERIFEAKCGKVFLSATHRAAVDRGFLVIGGLSKESIHDMRVPECGTYVFGTDTKFRFSEIEVGDGFAIDKSRNTAMLDAALLSFPLTIRQIREGDWFVPFGMKGRKLLSDYLTDRKMCLFDKERQIVVEDAQGNVVWLAGERTDNRFRISETTSRALVIKIVN